MADKPKKYCDGIDCAFCSEKEPCIYKIANRLESELKHKEQEYNKLYIQLEADEEYHKEEENTLRKIIKNKEERNIELYKENNKLKAKEQECERLNEYSVGFARKCQKLELDVFHLKDKNYSLQRQLDQFKAENSKLKQRIIEIDRSYKNRQEELEQTLNEIKEIVSKSYFTKLELKDCIECDASLAKILQIIDEVE